MYVLNFAHGSPKLCTSRDEAVRLFFYEPTLYFDFFEGNRAVLTRHVSSNVIFVMEDVRLPNDVCLKLERIVLTESIHDMSCAIKEFVSDQVRADLVRVEANTFNISQVLEALSNSSASHAYVRVDYLDNDYVNSF